ncbi:hypothetical protein A9179_00095 [Pseudomonas alcaligenes]|uniref:Uncharacterized protein n=1 Tax=Aquipseudomonas alcaligenes TaxID=43263 RepID=A0ABR7RUJ2_AQUAC|nr:hypothetical protein [Pseudomonas alcaligenes]MBC9248663.1 hypothetical protein [Pseudomonas alcaligenes]
MSAEILNSLTTRSIALAGPKQKTVKKIKLKVFWKTANFWTEAAIKEYHATAPAIAERLVQEQYWDKSGNIKNNKFTCEDFAIRLLCEFASPRQLPVKLKTGVRAYRNMEIYQPVEHDHYVSHMYGFAEMVMLTYGAPDMQRVGENVIALQAPAELMPGDILAQATDRPGNVAHHIQVAMSVNANQIEIKQGNTSGISVRPFTTVQRMLGSNMADPQNDGYAGMPIENGIYNLSGSSWNYRNLSTGSSREDFLKIFQFYRWNFMEFNKE